MFPQRERARCNIQTKRQNSKQTIHSLHHTLLPRCDGNTRPGDLSKLLRSFPAFLITAHLESQLENERTDMNDAAAGAGDTAQQAWICISAFGDTDTRTEADSLPRRQETPVRQSLKAAVYLAEAMIYC